MTASRTTTTTPAPPAVRARRPGAWLAAAVVLLAVGVFVSLAVGARPLGAGTVLDALLTPSPATGDHAVVLARLPRTITALLAGMGLGLAGGALQGMTRNPLADPGILGLNAGAAFAVVTAIHLLGIVTPSGYVWFAFLGAAAAAVVTWSVAGLGRGGPTPLKLVLAGAALTAGLSSLMNAVLITDQQTLDLFRFWQMGSVAITSWDRVTAIAPFLAVGTLLVLACGRTLNGLALGDDVARGLGQNVTMARAVAGLGAVILCGAATTLAGPIVFVGLVVPHMVRAVTGPDYRWLLPLSALTAPALMLLADAAGRVVMPPGEVPVGVMVSLIGAPVFIWLVRRRRTVTL